MVAQKNKSGKDTVLIEITGIKIQEGGADDVVITGAKIDGKEYTTTSTLSKGLRASKQAVYHFTFSSGVHKTLIKHWGAFKNSAGGYCPAEENLNGPLLGIANINDIVRTFYIFGWSLKTPYLCIRCGTSGKVYLGRKPTWTK